MKKLYLKRLSRRTAIIIFITALGIVPGQTGCARKNKDISKNTAPREVASPTPAIDARMDVPAQGDAQSYVNQGDEYLKSDQDKEALESFRRAVEIDKDLGVGYLKLGMAYNALNLDEEANKAYKSAIGAYEKKIKTEPKNARAHYEMGQAYYRLGKYEEAARAFSQATRFEPENGDMFFELGMSHYKMARYDAAVVALKKSITLDPDNYRAVEALEKAQDGQKRIAEMVKHQKDSMKKQSNGNANAESNANASPVSKSSP
jgi:superkiller protein 3